MGNKVRWIIGKQNRVQIELKRTRRKLDGEVGVREGGKGGKKGKSIDVDVE